MHTRDYNAIGQLRAKLDRRFYEQRRGSAMWLWDQKPSTKQARRIKHWERVSYRLAKRINRLREANYKIPE